jgi:hypothetical protein
MPKSPKTREDRQVHIREDETERRFNETVRNLLNTPPKPHKARDINGRAEGPPRKRKKDKDSA